MYQFLFVLKISDNDILCALAHFGGVGRRFQIYGDFLLKQEPSFKRKRKLIHMDADLFSATLFALSQLYPYLQKGDIIMFDEFNVYGHEFKAFRLFTECFYVKLKLISARNNFYHAAFEVE